MRHFTRSVGVVGVGLLGATAGVATARAATAGAGSSGASTVIMFPSRIDRCGLLSALWSQFKLASLATDPEALSDGLSSVLSEERWAKINGLPAANRGAATRPPKDRQRWPGMCESFDTLVTERMAALMSVFSGEDWSDNDPQARQLDGDRLGLSWDGLAERYGGAAFVAPYVIVIPGCINPPEVLAAEVLAAAGEGELDFGKVVDRLSEALDDDGPCVTPAHPGTPVVCRELFRELVMEVGQLVSAAPFDPEIADHVVDFAADLRTLIRDNLATATASATAADASGDPTGDGSGHATGDGSGYSYSDFLRETVPPVMEGIKARVAHTSAHTSDTKEPSFLGFLEALRDELKEDAEGVATSSGTAVVGPIFGPISERVERFLHDIHC